RPAPSSRLVKRPQQPIALKQVQFAVDSEVVGTLQAPPFQWTWDATEVTLGDRTLSATATDVVGRTTTATVSVRVKRFCPGDDCPPEGLMFVDMEPGQVVSGVVVFAVEAEDNEGLASLVVEVDGMEIARGSASPLEVRWDSDGVPEGEHMLRAVATDTGGQSIEATSAVWVDRTRPEIDLVMPMDREVVDAQVECEATATDSVGVASVQFGVLGTSLAERIENGPPWRATVDVAGLETGEYTLLATASDQAGNTRQDARTLVVDRPPEVVFTAPEERAAIREEVFIVVEASDDVALERVDLFEGDRLLGPFDEAGRRRWTPSGPANSDVVLRAVAVDHLGQEQVAERTVVVEVAPCDRDGDGALSDDPMCNGDDCDDSAFDFGPQAEDSVGDELDQNCDGLDGVDMDRDGFASAPSGGRDCDDNDNQVFPCAFDPPGLCTDRFADRNNCGACSAACDLGLACIESSCVCTAEDCVPGSPDDYAFTGPDTFFYAVNIELSESAGYDLDDDGTPDNALGVLMDTIDDLFQGNVNAELNRQIRLGELALGATWPTLDFETPLTGATGVQMDVFALADVDDDPSTTNRFLATRESFIDGHQTPRSRFRNGTITGVSIEIGPADNFFVTLPIQGVSLRVAVEEALMRGTIFRDSTGVRLSSARIGGVLTLVNFVDAVNEYLQSDACSCLELEGPMIDLRIDRGSDACIGDYSTDSCTGARQGLCTAIAVQCGLFMSLIEVSLDLDIDGDGEMDAMSAMLRLDGQGTDIEGVVPEIEEEDP
ncbi:MAG: Ig-like domain-containing protein, partial [Myxococcota bacterium]